MSRTLLFLHRTIGFDTICSIQNDNVLIFSEKMLFLQIFHLKYENFSEKITFSLEVDAFVQSKHNIQNSFYKIVTTPSGRINWRSWKSRYKRNNRKNIDNETKTLSNREKSFVAPFNRVEVFKYCSECFEERTSTHK